MRITGIEKVKSKDGRKSVRIKFFGCNLRCPYCFHITEKQKQEKLSVEEILSSIRAFFGEEVGRITLGGAEPTIQKDLIELVRSLKEEGHTITLKTDGFRPDVLEELLDYVDRFVIEIKAPLDDIDANAALTGLSRERASVYVEKLRETLDLLRKEQKKFRAWIRVIPEYVNIDTIRAIGEDIRGADDAMLYQFLSDPTYDIPFEGYTTPVPPREEIDRLAEILLEYVPRIEIKSAQE
ncbi:MAG: Radical SAM domain protein [Candidatus Syntrophoarchaeum caldarius]|uniref:Radical SAM domain protein n=1 Tax=Candidatus Syntropharchaeum caldarium TaxID=1838285 RepID=A0A1F2P9Z6_9EURY|nr:MAG: Radical SAM domain protein [Candidatus Syntrophoarchaeum caldarius]